MDIQWRNRGGFIVKILYQVFDPPVGTGGRDFQKISLVIVFTSINVDYFTVIKSLCIYLLRGENGPCIVPPPPEFRHCFHYLEFYRTDLHDSFFVGFVLMG